MDRRGVVQSWAPYVTNNPSRISICSHAEMFSLLLSYSGIVSLRFVVFLSLFSHFSMYTVFSHLSLYSELTLFSLLLLVSQSLSSMLCFYTLLSFLIHCFSLCFSILCHVIFMSTPFSSAL